ncbi:hypothetical protein EB151_13755, partial [archaeon]|nr:hypothetical protein [archaeon]
KNAQTTLTVEIISSTGTFTEIHDIYINPDGEFKVQLGTGVSSGISFSNIDWSSLSSATYTLPNSITNNNGVQLYQNTLTSDAVYFEMPFKQIDSDNIETSAEVEVYLINENTVPLRKKTSSGFSYAFVSRSDTEAIMEFQFPDGYDAITTTNFFQNLRYDIKYKGTNVLTNGTRRIEINSIAKEATDKFNNDVDRFYPMYVDISFDVIGNAETIFENRGPKSSIENGYWSESTPWVLFPGELASIQSIATSYGNPSNYENWELKIRPSTGINAQEKYILTGNVSLNEDNTSVIHNGNEIATYQETSVDITLVFNSNASQAIVEEVIESFAYFISGDEPIATSTIAKWTFKNISNPADVLETIRLFFVVPENDGPKLTSF